MAESNCYDRWHDMNQGTAFAKIPKTIVNNNLKLLLPICIFYSRCQNTFSTFQDAFAKCELSPANWNPGWRVAVGQAVMNTQCLFCGFLSRVGHKRIHFCFRFFHTSQQGYMPKGDVKIICHRNSLLQGLKFLLVF